MAIPCFDQVPDQILVQILCQLPPLNQLQVERVNSHWRELVHQSLTQTVTTVTAGSLNGRPMLTPASSCAHFRHSDPLHTLSFGKLFKHIQTQRLAAAGIVNDELSTTIKFSDGFAAHPGRLLFLDCVRKFGTNLRSIDFTGQLVTGKILLAVSAACPLIECLAFDQISFSEPDWHLFVSSHANRLKHINLRVAQGRHPRGPSTSRAEVTDGLKLEQILKILADQNPGQIEEIAIRVNDFTQEVYQQILRLQQPNNAKVRVEASELNFPLTDVIHSITTNNLSWRAFAQDTYTGLTSLVVNSNLNVHHSTNPVNFSGLESLTISCYESDLDTYRLLARCQFNQLKSLILKRTTGLFQDEYSSLFRAMPALKHLKIDFDLDQSMISEPFPGHAITWLERVKSIEFLVSVSPSLDWQSLLATINAVEQLRTLRVFKLNVYLKDDGNNEAQVPVGTPQRTTQWRLRVGRQVQQLRQNRRNLRVSYVIVDQRNDARDEESDDDDTVVVDNRSVDDRSVNDQNVEDLDDGGVDDADDVDDDSLDDLSVDDSSEDEHEFDDDELIELRQRFRDARRRDDQFDEANLIREHSLENLGRGFAQANENLRNLVEMAENRRRNLRQN